MVPHNRSKFTSLKDFQLDLTFFDLTILPFLLPPCDFHLPLAPSPPLFLTPPVSNLSISHSLFAVPSLADMGADSKVFTLEDVSKHNTHKDCWLLIGGKVLVICLDAFFSGFWFGGSFGIGIFFWLICLYTLD